MEGAEQALNEFYVEIFGERKPLVGDFKTIARFEEVMGGSILDSKYWNPPMVTAVVALLWAAIGGKGSKRTLEEIHAQLTGEQSIEVTKLSVRIWEDFNKAGAKNGDAAA